MQKKGLLGQLIQNFCCLPGIGPKSAQRITFYMLQRDRNGAKLLAETLLKALDQIGHCEQCRTLTDQTLCEICTDNSRNAKILCIVESPADAWIIDQATAFKGTYFILHGR